MNQLSNPIFPDIKKGPPRFQWTRKHWVVDPGRVQMQAEHIPQLQEAAVLVQNRDYNKQFAYGNFPKYTTFVNKEFRPPLIERDDLLPLSRIPRPVIVPRINPGTAFSSGGSAFAEQNMGMPQVEKYLTDRVKEGEIRPTFFAPISMPEDNSILPDLELKLPPVSASAGYAFPAAMGAASSVTPRPKLDYKSEPVAMSAGTRAPVFSNSYNAMNDLELEYNRPQVSVVAREGYTPINLTDLFGDDPIGDLEYNRPQVSAASGNRAHAKGMTLINVDDMEYNRPQVSAASGYRSNTKGMTLINVDDLEYNKPQVSAGAGYSGYTNSVENNGMSRQEMELETKIPGTQGGVATATYSSVYDPGAAQGTTPYITDSKGINHYSYVVPSNTSYQKSNVGDRDMFFREKQRAIGRQHGVEVKGHVRRAGVDQPQVKMRMRKG
jgi:hypothetical protein